MLLTSSCRKSVRSLRKSSKVIGLLSLGVMFGGVSRADIKSDCLVAMTAAINRDDVSVAIKLLNDPICAPFLNVNEALFEAVGNSRGDYPDMVAALIAAGGDPAFLKGYQQAGQVFGATLLHIAVASVHPASLEVLVSALKKRPDIDLTAFVNREDVLGDGMTALTTIAYVLNRHAFPNRVLGIGLTTQGGASDAQLLRIAKCLVPVGAGINVTYTNGPFLRIIWDDVHYHQLMTYLWAQGGRV